MKYVFLAHSNTILLTSLGVIDHLHLNHDDVMFLFTRGFNSALPLSSYKRQWADDVYNQSSSIVKQNNPLRLLKGLKEIDEIIGSWVGDEYEVFLPHLAHPFFKVLYTHRLCKKVSFVQEGAFTIKGAFHNELSKWKKRRMLLGQYLKRWNNRFYGYGWYCDGILRHQKRIDAYAISDSYFKYLDCDLRIVNWPDIDFKPEEDIDGPVFIFDGFVTNGLCAYDYYLNQCRSLINKFCKEKNYIKFHPAQGDDEKQEICRLFLENGVENIQLKDTIPFEFYMKKLPMLTLIGFGSSLLYFGKALGHKVYCCDTWMMDSPQYRSKHEKGYPLFCEVFEDEETIEK